MSGLGGQRPAWTTPVISEPQSSSGEILVLARPRGGAGENSQVLVAFGQQLPDILTQTFFPHLVGIQPWRWRHCPSSQSCPGLYCLTVHCKQCWMFPDPLIIPPGKDVALVIIFINSCPRRHSTEILGDIRRWVVGVAFVWIVDRQPLLGDGIRCARKFSLKSSGPLSILVLIRPRRVSSFIRPAP